MEVLETYTLGNKTLEIHPSDITESPRGWDNISTFVFSSNGDKTNFRFKSNYDSRAEFIEKGAEEIYKHFKDVAVCLPVHKYSHSGTGYSTDYSYPYNCPYDSGTIGFLVVTKEQIRERFGIKYVTKPFTLKAKEIAKGELETFSQWGNGEVYGFTIKENGEEIDSCQGFYGMNMSVNGLVDYAGEEWREVLKSN